MGFVELLMQDDIFVQHSKTLKKVHTQTRAFKTNRLNFFSFKFGLGICGKRAISRSKGLDLRFTCNSDFFLPALLKA